MGAATTPTTSRQPRWWLRLQLLLCLWAIAQFVGAGPAAAHSASEAPASNYWGRVVSVSPATTDFTLSVIEATSRLELRWRRGPEITVLGYEGDPYLRVGREGVFENQSSASTYANRSREGTSAMPAGVGPDVAPRWVRTSRDPVARWHDHRAHWMGAAPPPAVTRAPGRAHLVQTWTITVRQGTTEHAIAGELRWRPGPSPIPYYAAAGVLGAAVAGAALLLRALRRARAALALLGAALLALVAIDAAHVHAIAAGVRGSGYAGRVFSVGALSMLVWAAAIVAAVLLLRGRDGGAFLAVFAAGCLMAIGGFADLSVLSRSSPVTALPAGVLRALVAATLGLGAGIVLAAAFLQRPRAVAAVADPGTDADPGTVAGG